MQHVNEFLALVNDAKTRVKEIDIQGYVALKEAGTPHILIDTREESEWGRGHLPGAIHLGKGIIERDIVSKVPDKSTTLVLYCGGGFRSALAGDNLMKMGYQDVISMDGGWTGWNKAGLPVEKD
ncbi:MAG: sulfurtransferase [Bryobacteraceae bacterium]|jgi:rhodanese-related sulfurtransferase|nr:sulfurtransferase [Bryobacteraceae bacterium]